METAQQRPAQDASSATEDESTPPLALPGKSHNLDALRSYAVLLVVVAHLGLFFGPDPAPKAIHALGRLGVSLFFVHTALVLMQSLQRHGPYPDTRALLLGFYLRRAFRIYPLAMTAVAATYVLGWPLGVLKPGGFVDNGPTLTTLLANLLLVQNFFKGGDVLVPLWSLPYEIQMYAVLPLLYVWSRRARTTTSWIIAWALLVVASAALSARVTAFGNQLGLRIPRFLEVAPEFLPGIVAYLSLGWRRQAGTLRWWWLPVFLCTSTAAASLTLERSTFPIVCLALGLLLPLLAEPTLRFVNRATDEIARYSYAIYLLHCPCMWLAFQSNQLSPVWQWLAFALLLTTSSVFAYHVIEAPMMRVGARLANRWSPGTRLPQPAASVQP